MVCTTTAMHKLSTLSPPPRAQLSTPPRPLETVKLIILDKKGSTRCRSPPSKRFLGFSSSFMRIAECFTALRIWRKTRVTIEVHTYFFLTLPLTFGA